MIKIEKNLAIWLKLIFLTLLSASFAETEQINIVAIIVVCVIVLIKGHWIIDEFMALKNASTLTRTLIKSYLYVITTLICSTLIYQQLTTNMT